MSSGKNRSRPISPTATSSDALIKCASRACKLASSCSAIYIGCRPSAGHKTGCLACAQSAISADQRGAAYAGTTMPITPASLAACITCSRSPSNSGASRWQWLSSKGQCTLALRQIIWLQHITQAVIANSDRRRTHGIRPDGVRVIL